jgi:AcrR family transcriptional regulator
VPTPDRTSLEDIVAAGRALLESAGLTGLTMQAVAERVGVRAPSLYKRVRNRDDLIRLVAEATVRDLGDRLRAVADGGDLAVLARAYREFAHAYPAGYHLIFAPGPAAQRPDLAAVSDAAAPILTAAADLAGPAHALEAARTITAWANGFLSMELTGAFSLGGSVDAAYEFGIARLTAALTDPGIDSDGPTGHHGR